MQDTWGAPHVFAHANSRHFTTSSQKRDSFVPMIDLVGDHTKTGANCLLAMKVPPCFPSSTEADILCIEVISIEKGHEQHRAGSTDVSIAHLDTCDFAAY